MKFTAMLAAAATLATTANAHSRIACPPARNMDGFDSTSIKYGPCGDDTGDFSAPTVDIQPGPLTIHIQESIQHAGSGWAFYLSEDGNDNSRCLMLDHIPADPNGKAFPSPGTSPQRESDWDQLFITLDIPDVACEKCSIQMQNIMVDKASDEVAAPWGTGCTYDGESGSCMDIGGGYGYHSCSVPLRINGTIPRADYACTGQPSDWPTEWVGDEGAPVDASVQGLYRREEGQWENGFPRDIPEQYKTWSSQSVQLQDAGTCPFVAASRN